MTERRMQSMSSIFRLQPVYPCSQSSLRVWSLSKSSDRRAVLGDRSLSTWGGCGRGVRTFRRSGTSRSCDANREDVIRTKSDEITSADAWTCARVTWL